MPRSHSTTTVSDATGNRREMPQEARHNRRRRTTAMPQISPPELPDSWSMALLGYELDAESRGLKSRSIENRKSAIRGAARWLEAEHAITDPADVTKAHLQLCMSRAHKERAKSGARTHYNDLKAFFSWYAIEYKTDNPIAGIPRPSDVVVPVPVLTSQQLGKVLASVSGRDWLSVRDNAIIHVLLETGVRRAELCGLDVRDVDVRSRELTVRHGKGGTSRVVVCGPATASALHRLIRMHPDTGGALFTSKKGRRLAECSVGAMLHRRGEQAGMPGLRAHMFRHSWAHYGLSAGLQEHEMMTLGGWSSTTQLGRYGASMAVVRAKAAGKERPVLGLLKAS